MRFVACKQIEALFYIPVAAYAPALAGISRRCVVALLRRLRPQLLNVASYVSTGWGTQVPQLSASYGTTERRALLPSGAEAESADLIPQISFAYSVTVRSLEKYPTLATFKIAFGAQTAGSAYSAS